MDHHLHAGVAEIILGVDGSGQPHVWKSLDECVDFLRREIGIVRFELIDAAGLGDSATTGRHGNDALDEPAQEITYEQWLKSELEKALNDPRPSIPGDDVERLFAERRNALLKRIAKGQEWN